MMGPWLKGRLGAHSGLGTYIAFLEERDCRVLGGGRVSKNVLGSGSRVDLRSDRSQMIGGGQNKAGKSSQ